MTRTMRHLLMLLLGSLLSIFAAGCSMPVLKQDIPVSTNPVGARIYADGQFAGVTPTRVSLERNRSHILTLVKENYRQADVVITNQYQKERVYLKAIQSGINSGLFFKNASMGMGSGMNSISNQEETGEAYILTPPAVSVSLMPLSGAGAAVTAPAAVTAYPGPDNSAAMDQGEMTKELLKMGAGAALSQTAPIGKESSSTSSRNYVTSDGTRVQEKTTTSVGVKVNPAGLIGVLDTLFQ
ncbi:PEGA domain-containing protein [Trichlorobacter lovleyi]|uniref:PEGA domain-containing protein n=1 Tax=Trichlorobacter lovleyi TaxID=313985 RepID=UPI00247FBD08|nr:PEGA domain-containing protein [Trichlorobacter lovleyi]